MSESRALHTDTELFAASLFQLCVTVWERTADDIPVRIEDGGVIERFTPNSVKINGAYYMRSECEFRVGVGDAPSLEDH
ncbi:MULTISPECIES: hypothetical protein [Paenibacillus]|uniref:hypothetical protein n=1 Tax=Paenibacillus TaxID=44249 RepID=UPI0022B91C34|nr:hypothetical protein [Paenibacillus caseinilyticus]MCZ8521772.1 hypothetical protein [Paenibacillus caseinilyticus]